MLNPMQFSNPFRDQLTGPGYIEVYERHQKYSKTYDNDERDRDRTVGVTDIHDSSGDAYVGSNMIFRSDQQAKVYEETRFNGAEADPNKLWKLSFQEYGGKLEVLQYTDDDGDKRPEVHRISVVDLATSQLEKVIDKTV